MQITDATEEKREEIINLLQLGKLPSEDLPLSLANFYTAIEQEQVVGVIGMERYGGYGLLRSMVVHAGYRNRNIAGNLVETLEKKALASGVTSIYLLTETADKYFSKKGYSTVPRTAVPKELMESSEFSYACPSSATVMKKELR